ncbi:hypothetical protein GGI25_001596 [Coemansia spiralis]|uniref:YMC020W-like alpha/beta hydrolase domain-containing protein n=1 Tax=Coemansia spiralis TaxID=417178 RepID=A0A9W8GBP8_9FUNG|nr:hypothetical protein GGI25_001596 [Coemansia spiralis]
MASSLRAASIPSSVRSSVGCVIGDGAGSLITESQPSVATTFAGDAHPVEARGQIYIQPQVTSKRATNCSDTLSLGRKKALTIMKPLAALSNSSTQSLPVNNTSTSRKNSTASATSTFCASNTVENLDMEEGENKSKATGNSSRSNSSQSTTLPDKGENKGDDKQALVKPAVDVPNKSILSLKAVSARPRKNSMPATAVVPVSAQSSPGRKSEEQQSSKQVEHNQGSYSISLWSALSRFKTATAPTNVDQQPSRESTNNLRKQAIDHLKTIEAKQKAVEASHHPSENSAAAVLKTETFPVTQKHNQSDESGDLEVTDQKSDIAEHSSDNISENVNISSSNSGSNDDPVHKSNTLDTECSPDSYASANGKTVVTQSEQKNNDASGGWLWGWIGSRSSNAAVSSKQKDSSEPAPITEPALVEQIVNVENQTTVSSAPAPADAAHDASSEDGASAEGTATFKPKSKTTATEANESGSKDSLDSSKSSNKHNAKVLGNTESDSHGHNHQQKTNMLLPDLVIGNSVLPSKLTQAHTADDNADDGSNNEPGSEHVESNPNKSRNSSIDALAPALMHKKKNTESEEYDAEKPLYKRLRTFGRTAIGSAIDMAPSWARSMLYGQHAADTLGQQHSSDDSHDSAGLTAEKIKKSMDLGATQLGRIAIIGVHGWFPTRMLQMLAGEPTGKSEKFCLMMRDALQSYLLDSHGIKIDDSDISLFPLVGEGRIEDRVELLLSQIIDTTEEPDLADVVPKESGSGSRSSSRASHADTASLQPPTSSSDVNKGKQQLKSKSPVTATAADSNNSSSGPSSKQSKMMANVLMPERSKRADVLSNADTVFVVTHSQGTPVSAMILERLLEMGIVDTTRQRVGMLAMAGISHGPLPYLKDNVVIKYIESEAARELFELMDPSSPQSQRYVAALSTILHKGVRLSCVGAWVDEVVPLYSAILQGVSHQNVYRAAYIDAPHYLDDFLTNLIVFALRLRNMGIYDHDLLIHLSEVVAGSLWGHSGHSTIYGEPAVYKLLVKWLLYSTSSVTASSIPTSTSVPTAPLWRYASSSSGDQRNACPNVSGPQIHMSYRPFNASEQLNPFYIPWIMRTLWDEPEIRQNEGLRTELQRLVKLFDQWSPETKVGKELKYRLEPVRAAI